MFPLNYPLRKTPKPSSLQVCSTDRSESDTPIHRLTSLQTAPMKYKPVIQLDQAPENGIFTVRIGKSVIVKASVDPLVAIARAYAHLRFVLAKKIERHKKEAAEFTDRFDRNLWRAPVPYGHDRRNSWDAHMNRTDEESTASQYRPWDQFVDARNTPPNYKWQLRNRR